MPTPIELLKKDVAERCEYWQSKSRKGGIAEPAVVAGVLLGVLDRIRELFPVERRAVVVKRVLKRRV